MKLQTILEVMKNLFNKVKHDLSILFNIKPKQKYPTYFTVKNGVLATDDEKIDMLDRPAQAKIISVNTKLTDYGKFLKEQEKKAKLLEEGCLPVVNLDEDTYFVTPIHKRK